MSSVKSRSKPPRGFEQWLDTNGYYCLRTKNNTPCYKSPLTKRLKKKYNEERKKSIRPGLLTRIASLNWGIKQY